MGFFHVTQGDLTSAKTMHVPHSGDQFSIHRSVKQNSISTIMYGNRGGGNNLSVIISQLDYWTINLPDNYAN